VRSVLQLIADFTNLNLVASDAVDGNITLRLQNVPWDQALDLVLRTKGLDKRLVGNVLMVDLAEGIAGRERQELESRKQMAELAPLYRELIQVNYAKADKVVELLKAAVKDDGGSRSDERGSITHDERTNSIIAYQTREKLDELRRIVAQLDIPVKQVMIEARIVEAKVEFAKELGVKWGSGSGFKMGNKGGTPRWTANPRPGGSFVDLGVNGPDSSGIGFGYVGSNFNLDLELSAMQTSGNGEVISQPKVMTANQQTAKISKGIEIPYREESSGGGATVSFKEAAMSLEVTPQITPDNKIIMEVKVNKDSPGAVLSSGGGEPSVDKNEVTANVLVGDGETVVIGGIFESKKTKDVSKVPFLGDLPFVGSLFRRDSSNESKEELLVFITPRIVSSQSLAAAP